MNLQANYDALNHEDHDENRSNSLSQVITRTIERERWHQHHVEKLVKHHADDHALLIAGLDDHRFIEHCDQLRILHKAITGENGPPCVNTVSSVMPRGPQLPAIKLTPMGKRILECCRVYADNDHWGAAWVNHIFHPVVTVLLRAMKRYAMPIAQLQTSASSISHELEVGCLLSRLVRFVRRVCGSWQFINILNAHVAKEKSNFNSARDYIYYLAWKHTRLCFLRLDLTLRPNARDFSQTEEANKAVAAYLRSLRSKACKRNLLPGYLGFFIKRENGISRGTHYHLMIVLNGDLQGRNYHSVEYLSDKLGQMWLRRVGHDRGSFHNNYKDRFKWVFNGLGLQDFSQIKPLVGLRVALHYLTKQDCVLKTSNTKIRNYWRTTSPSARRTKRGPKRKHPDRLALLYRMLGGSRSLYPPGFDPTPYVLAHKRKQVMKPDYGHWDYAPDIAGELPA